MLPVRIDRDELQRRIDAVERAYSACRVCARRCGADRRVAPGDCGLGMGARYYKEYVHFGEEEVLVPSHTIYMTGCSMRCVFCSDDPVVRDPGLGREVVPDELAALIARRREEGARNVNFVGGVPDVNLLAILRTLRHCPADTHVVWNTNLYSTPDTMALLDGIVDTWLADYKFGNDQCARKLSGAERYTDVLRECLVQATGRLIVRHLVMPEHLDCCTRPVLCWLAANLPSSTVNLMTAYMPYALARRIPTLSRRTSKPEAQRARELLVSLFPGPRMVDGRLLTSDGSFH